MKDLTASQITLMAIKELTWRGCEVWRQNQIRVPGRAFNGKAGLSDIIGFNKKTGLIVMCEVKTINDKFSSQQLLLLAQVKNSGGIALVATQNDKGNFTLLNFAI